MVGDGLRSILARIALFTAAALIVAGVALLSIAAALIVGGLELLAIALFVLEVNEG